MAKNRFFQHVPDSIPGNGQSAAGVGAVRAQTAEIGVDLKRSAAPVVVLMPGVALASGHLTELQQQVFAAASALARATLAPPRHERLIEAGWN